MTSPAMKKLIQNLERKLAISRAQGTTSRQALPKGKQHSPNVPGRKTGLAPEREGHSGRKGDILEDYHNKTGIYEGRKNARPPLILKVTIAGSGCEVWMTHASEDGKKSDEALAKMDLPDLDSWWSGSAPATFANKKGDITFSGPQALMGMSDTGKNSIAELVKHVPTVIKRAIPKEYKSGADVVLLIKAHSRGAVAAVQVAEKIKADLPKMRVELTQFDPVPGPASAYGKNAEATVGDHTKPEHDELQPDLTVERVGKQDVEADVKLDESTLIYSMGAQNGSFFKPQRIHGAKRIIISAQVHGGGTRKGYKVGGKLFKGSRLNSLPPGAYYEKELERGGPKEEKYSEFKHIGILEKMTKEDFYDKLQITYDAREGMGDWGRFAVVRDALEEFFARNG